MGKVSLPLSTVKRHLLPAGAAFCSVLGAALAYWLSTPAQYQTSARIMVDQRGTSISDLGQALADSSSLPQGANPIATQAELVKSQRVLRRAIDKVFPPGSNAAQTAPTSEQVAKKLRIKIVPATNILELAYQDKDPQSAAKLLNAIVNAVAEESAEAIRTEASSVRKFLETRLPTQQRRLEQAENAESRYRQQTRLISVDAQTASLVSSLAEVENQERTLSSQLQEARVRDSQLQRVTGMSALSSAYSAIRVGQDASLQRLREQVSTLESQVIDARSRLGDRHPDLLALMERRDQTRQLYTRRLGQILGGGAIRTGSEVGDEVSRDLVSRYILGEIERNATGRRLQVIRAERAKLQTRVAQLPQLQQPLATLVRQREEAAATLKLLQGKLEEARIAEAQLVSNVRVIDNADIPEAPSVPKPAVVLALALAAGTLLAGAVILVCEMLDDSIRDAAEAEALLKLPVLGVLPDMSGFPLTVDQLEVFLDQPEQVEPYRLLLKSLEHSSEKPLRAITVSSLLSGDGKSGVVARLSAVAAMLSRNTLVIDADLRQPVQARIFNVSGEPGLSNVVVEGQTLQQVAQVSQIDNLTVLPSGQLLARPSAIAEAVQTRELMELVMEEYDLCILDTSPISVCADAAAFSQMSDGLVLVVQRNLTSREKARQAVAELRKTGTPILGVVISGAPDILPESYRTTPASKPLAGSSKKVVTLPRQNSETAL